MSDYNEIIELIDDALSRLDKNEKIHLLNDLKGDLNERMEQAEQEEGDGRIIFK